VDLTFEKNFWSVVGLGLSFKKSDWIRIAKCNSPLISASNVIFSLQYGCGWLVARFSSSALHFYQRWSDSGFSLSDPILFLKNYIRIRSESCFGWNHTIRIRKLSESILRCTTYIFVLCLFCLMRLN